MWALCKVPGGERICCLSSETLATVWCLSDFRLWSHVKVLDREILTHRTWVKWFLFFYARSFAVACHPKDRLLSPSSWLCLCSVLPEPAEARHLLGPLLSLLRIPRHSVFLLLTSMLACGQSLLDAPCLDFSVPSLVYPVLIPLGLS